MTNAVLKAVPQLFCAVRIAGIFHKACNCPLFVVLELTVMHRCCGVYDFGFLRVVIAAPNTPPTFACVFVPGTICPRPLAECVRWTACHTGAGPWRAGCVDEPSVRTTLLLLALTNTVLSGWCSLAVVVVVLVHMVCAAHCVDDSLVVSASHFCDYFISYSFLVCRPLFSFNSIQIRKQGEQCLQSAIECKVAMPGVERLLCRKEIVGRERGRSLRVTQINPLRLAEERRNRSNNS
ncbi:putative retrotransposon hot spot (RHS) protein [Trypanosoma cruzi]|uniref:Putative retrotransposon hot spot (RHS) protein n=1 Tax=Trypanosoma cruzi TaxID=5693 RepID=A0A2V2UF50_TRYCR|nr:putative retrotransposon hot spot (RHS) protein [Trypanosoma cruzi]